MHLQPKTSKEEVQEILSKSKQLFQTKKRLTRILVGESLSVQDETEEFLKKFLGLVQEELEQIEIYEEEDIPKALVIEGEISDIFEIDEIFTQMEKELEGGTTSIPTATSVPNVPTITIEEPVLPKDIPTGKGEEKKDIEVNTQIDDVKIIEPLEKDKEMQKDTQESVHVDVEQIVKSPKKANEKQKEEYQEKKVTYQSLTSKKIVDDDEDDDTISIQGLINMDMLSPT